MQRTVTTTPPRMFLLISLPLWILASTLCLGESALSHDRIGGLDLNEDFYLCPGAVDTITQDKVNRSSPAPFVIALPGRYCLTEDITFYGAVPSSIAILIQSDDVELWFGGHTLLDASIYPDATAVQVAPGFANIVVDGGDGAVLGFGTGIDSDGNLLAPVENLTIRDLRLEHNRGGSIMVRNTRGSSIEENSIQVYPPQNPQVYVQTAIGLNGPCTGTVVRDNRVGLSPGANPQPNEETIQDQRALQFGISGSRTQGIEILRNQINANELLTGSYVDQIGIDLHHGTHNDDPQFWGRDNVVEGNIIRGADKGILLAGSGTGSDNIVAFNEIYGGSVGHRGWPSEVQATSSRKYQAGIAVGNESRIWLHDNLVYSGPNRGYYFGIFLHGDRKSSMTPRYFLNRISGGFELLPGITGNETCGVVEPYVAPLWIPPVDHLNSWNTCGGILPE